MRKYLAYVRVSTPKQGEKGVSLQEQRFAIERYADRHSLDIAEWIEERQTAAKRGRPAFAKLLKLLQRRDVAGVVMHKIDRSARNLRDWADLAELSDQGVEIHFAAESIDLHTNSGRLSADIQAVVAANYIRNLREEALKGIYGRYKQGILPREAPIGYLDCGAGKPKQIDPVKGPLVRRAFELYDSGRHSLLSLHEELQRIGLHNRRGNTLSVNGISWMLNNPFYIGIIRVKRTGETFAGSHKPLITKALYDRVQERLQGRAPTKARRHTFLFRMLLLCGLCGRRLYGELQKEHVYYRCHSRECKTCVREEAVDAAVRHELLRLNMTGEESRALEAKVLELEDTWQSKVAEEEKTLDLQLGAVKARLDRLTDAYLDGAIDKDAHNERRETLLHEERALKERADELRQNPEFRLARLRKVLELAESASLSYQRAGNDEKRDLIKLLFSNRKVHRKEVVVELSSPFQLLANRSNLQCGDLQRDATRSGIAMPEVESVGGSKRVTTSNSNRIAEADRLSELVAMLLSGRPRAV